MSPAITATALQWRQNRPSRARLALFPRACTVAALLHVAGAHCAPGASDPALHKVGRSELCVTNGVVSALANGRLAVNSASSRGVVRSAAGAVAEVRFKYLGPSAESKPLASGEMRRQIGLKLKAQDTCNLLYVMWHIEPDAKIGVSIKRNSGMHAHEQCHANGYANLKAGGAIQPPRIAPGESHVLRAELKEGSLEVFADGLRVWSGAVERHMFDFDGPVGFRTDNARFEFDYLAASVAADLVSNEVSERLNRCAPESGE